jgi:hypothetical protein
VGAVEVDRQQDDEIVRQQCAVEEERRGRDHVCDDDVEPSRPQPLRGGAGVGDPEALLLQTFVTIPRGHVSADDETPHVVHVDEGTTAGALGQQFPRGRLSDSRAARDHQWASTSRAGHGNRSSNAIPPLRGRGGQRTSGFVPLEDLIE